MIRLIINADDFGLTESVNRGIIECHRRGAVTSSTLLVNGQAAEAAASLLKDYPALGVGLHINLTSGPPILPGGKVPSLVGEDGLFPGMGAMVRRLATGRARKAELAAEVRAQLEKSLALGIQPTHVDSHHHLHALPRLRSVVQQVCAEAGITKMRGYRMSARSLKSLGVGLLARLPSTGASLRTPDRFSGIDVMGKMNMAEALSRDLAAPGDALEFMCHPGFNDERLAQVSSFNSLRQVELEALTSERFGDVLRAAGVKLISFRDL